MLWDCGVAKPGHYSLFAGVVTAVTGEALQGLSRSYGPSDWQLCGGGHSEAEGSSAMS